MAGAESYIVIGNGPLELVGIDEILNNGWIPGGINSRMS